MNIIFLDIDGVVATPDSCVAFEKLMWCIDPTKARMIERLCRETKSQLVITSTWRKGHTWVTFLDLLTAYQLDQYLFFVKDTANGLWRTTELTGIRGNEIDDWLVRADEYDEITIDKYIIIDDDNDFTQEQKEKYLIKTDFKTGFDSDDFYKAREMLGYIGEGSNPAGCVNKKK